MALDTTSLACRASEETEIGISSIVDSWLLLRYMELNGERNRGIYVLKARGTAHSNQIREFVLTSRGIELKPVYVGPEGVLTGSSRVAQEARENAQGIARRQEMEHRRRELSRRRAAVDSQIAALRSQLEEEEREIEVGIRSQEASERRVSDDRTAMARSRGAEPRAAQRQSASRRTGR